MRRRAPSENQALDRARIRPFGPILTEGNAASVPDTVGAGSVVPLERSVARVRLRGTGGPGPVGRRGRTRKLARRGSVVKFPLADWIDGHENCRHQLGSSGMVVSIRHPLPTARQTRDASVDELRERLARRHGVDPQRVFLTAGATEANTGVIFFLAHVRPVFSRRCRVRYPEYPPLFDTAQSAGWVATSSADPAGLAAISRPRNPEGYLESVDELERWSEGARHLLVDETFRDFSGAPSVATLDRPHTWVSGSLTKFFAADDLRVGYVVAPEEDRESYARFHGLLFDSLSDYSVAGAIECLHALPKIRRDVGAILGRNVAALVAGLPGIRPPVAPVYFDRVRGVEGETVTRRCLKASVLVCPGAMFGDPSGVRLCLTRRSFPRDLAAYLSIRRALVSERFTARPRALEWRRARPRRGGAVRGRAGPD